MTRGEGSPQVEKKRHYAKISRTVKEKLIKRVLEQGLPISSASKQYKIRLSTAKAIISKFRDTQKISETQKQRKKRIEKEKSQEGLIDRTPQEPDHQPTTSPVVCPNPSSIVYVWNPYFCAWVAFSLSP